VDHGDLGLGRLKSGTQSYQRIDMSGGRRRNDRDMSPFNGHGV